MIDRKSQHLIRLWFCRPTCHFRMHIAASIYIVTASCCIQYIQHIAESLHCLHHNLCAKRIDCALTSAKPEIIFSKFSTPSVVLPNTGSYILFNHSSDPGHRVTRPHAYTGKASIRKLVNIIQQVLNPVTDSFSMTFDITMAQTNHVSSHDQIHAPVPLHRILHLC